MKTNHSYICICLKDKCIWIGRPGCPICGSKKNKKIRKNSQYGKIIYEAIKQTEKNK